MHTPETRYRALQLVGAGHNDCDVARRIGVPRSTVRGWRREASRPRLDDDRPRCPRCWRRTRLIAPTDADYAELLGLYLGDGCIGRAGRVHVLRISLDVAYGGIVGDVRELLARCFPAKRVGEVRADDGATVVLSVSSSHMTCLFPQHGPGKKHERRIVLEPWQQRCVEGAPWAFLRGCFRADGCVFVNRTGRYEYVSYDFRNRSSDILDLFSATCDLVGVEHRRYGERIRVYRRASVALLMDEIGVKR
jgi:Homeodomain-like domain